MGVIIFGVALFCFGVFCMGNMRHNWPALVVAVVGLSIAFRGLADLVGHIVIQGLQRDNNLSESDVVEYDSEQIST